MLSFRPSGGRDAVCGMMPSAGCIWRPQTRTVGTWRVWQLTTVERRQMDKSPSFPAWIPESGRIIQELGGQGVEADELVHVPQANLGLITNITLLGATLKQELIYKQLTIIQKEFWSSYHSCQVKNPNLRSLGFITTRTYQMGRIFQNCTICVDLLCAVIKRSISLQPVFISTNGKHLQTFTRAIFNPATLTMLSQ